MLANALTVAGRSATRPMSHAAAQRISRPRPPQAVADRSWGEGDTASLFNIAVEHEEESLQTVLGERCPHASSLDACNPRPNGEYSCSTLQSRWAAPCLKY